MTDAIQELDAYFTSGNSTPVERATIKRIEWEAAKDQLTQDLTKAKEYASMCNNEAMNLDECLSTAQKDLATAQAEIARKHNALLEAKQLIMDINGKSYEFIEQALSQSSPSLDKAIELSTKEN